MGRHGILENSNILTVGSIINRMVVIDLNSFAIRNSTIVTNQFHIFVFQLRLSFYMSQIFIILLISLKVVSTDVKVIPTHLMKRITMASHRQFPGSAALRSRRRLSLIFGAAPDRMFWVCGWGGDVEDGDGEILVLLLKTLVISRPVTTSIAHVHPAI